MYDLIVIGGGPAGLTATVYAIRKRLNVLMISKDLGGKTNYRLALPWVEDYQFIHGLEIVNKFKNELEYLDFAHHIEPVDQVCKREDGFCVKTRGGGELVTKAVIVAAGTKQKTLKVPGEKEFIMRGLCYSALSYAPLFIDRTAVVVGDSELALRSTCELATVAQHVYLVCLCEKLPSSPLEKKLRRSENVTLLEDHEVISVKGDKYAESVVVADADGKTSELEADGIFIELGLIPNSGMVADLVKLDSQNRIQIDIANRTNVPGIFAAGDITTTYAEQVLVAVGEGAKAALSAYDYLLQLQAAQFEVSK